MTPSSDGGGGGNPTAEHPTAPRPRSRRRLHNFSFPTLRWGAQRILRCKSPVTASTSTSLHHHRHKRPQPNHDDGPQPSAAVRSPWNLRTRRFRSSGNEPPPPQHQAGDKNRSNASTANKSPSPEEKSEGEKGLGRAKFAVELTREEIEEDFLRMKGARPQRRPKKRVRIVQKKLDKLFPGLWLDEIMADSYKTND